MFNNKLYWKVSRTKNLPDTVTIDGLKYIVRFSAKHAQHIVDNINDRQHGITFSEIVELIKNSIVLPIEQKSSKRVSIGRHNGKIYATYFYVEPNRIDVVTSFMSGKIDYTFLFQSYENNEI